MWNNFPWLLAVKNLMKGNIFNCSSTPSVQVCSENASAWLLVVQSFQQLRGRGEPWTDCSLLKTCNFFSEVQEWMLPFFNDDGYCSCVNKAALGNSGARKVSVKELSIKWAIDCCAGKAPVLCQVDPGRASLFCLREFKQSFSMISFPLYTSEILSRGKNKKYPCLRSEFSNINSNSDCCLSQHSGVSKSLILAFLIPRSVISAVLCP